MPTACRFRRSASTNVVPLPQKMSHTTSPTEDSSWINAFGIWGMNFAG